MRGQTNVLNHFPVRRVRRPGFFALFRSGEGGAGPGERPAAPPRFFLDFDTPALIIKGVYARAGP